MLKNKNNIEKQIDKDELIDTSYEDALEKVISEIKIMLRAKHHDYGNTNLLKHGNIGIVVRLDDKLARLNNFFENTATFKVDEETLLDTYKDIAGYAIQAILMNEGCLE